MVCVSCLRWREKYGVRLAFIATPGHGRPSVAPLTAINGEIHPLLVSEFWTEREL